MLHNSINLILIDMTTTSVNVHSLDEKQPPVNEPIMVCIGHVVRQMAIYDGQIFRLTDGNAILQPITSWYVIPGMF